MKTRTRLALLMTLSAFSACAQPHAPVELSDQALVQADRVFDSVNAAEKEYQRLFSETKYPNDKEKKEAADWFTQQEAVFHMTRLSHLDLKQKRTREALTTFIGLAWQFVKSPEGIFTRYDYSDNTLKDGKETYASLSKMESIVAEFHVLAVSALKEAK